jgi:hypothetical protein
MDRFPEPLLRPTPHASKHGLEVVSVKVEQNEQTQLFTIHKNLLCKSSGFLRSTFSSQFLEGQTSCLELPAIDPLTFEVLYQLLTLALFAISSNLQQNPTSTLIFYGCASSPCHINTLQINCSISPIIPFENPSTTSTALYRFWHVSENCMRVTCRRTWWTCCSHLWSCTVHIGSWMISCGCWEWQTISKHPEFGAAIAWELTKRGSEDDAGVSSHPQNSVQFPNPNGRVFIKKDIDDAEIHREPTPSDDETAQDDSSTSQLTEYEDAEDSGYHWMHSPMVTKSTPGCQDQKVSGWNKEWRWAVPLF